MRPQDYAVFSLVDDPGSPRGKSIQAITPRDVVNVRDQQELRAQLDHYGRPLLKLSLPDTQFARRFYVERVRPALRYYCSALKVGAPEWLANDDDLLDLPDEEKLALFGTSQLEVREFSLVKKRTGSVADETHTPR